LTRIGETGRNSGAGSALAAVLASSCCVGPVLAPLIVAALGASGAAWAAGLKPYSPYLLAGSFALLLFGLWTTYRPRPACVDGTCPIRPGRSVKTVLWAAVALWTLAALLNLIVPSS
jgi:mercuric ion transport protein